jgi:DNA repair exonuclease SbcCD ATPase subunit
MITVKKLTLKNFLSVGAVVQTVDFDNQNLTLILGENLDLGGDGAKNGTGKTSILQGLSYALFGSAINNIKKDNLINRTNGKAMVVTVEFTVDGIEYRIERGRKPTFLKFFVNNQELATEETNDSQGDSRETQDAIDRVLSMSSDMFRHIVGLNTYNEPFLSLKANDQRIIIEQLLGITILSEKADAIKILNKQTRDEIQAEEYRMRAIEEANKRIQEQIDGLKRRQRLWIAKHDEDLNRLVEEYDNLSKIDIDAELKSHKELAVYTACVERKSRYDSLVARQTAWLQSRVKDIAALETKLTELTAIDIDSELSAHKSLAEYNLAVVEQTALKKEITRIERELLNEKKISDKLRKEIDTLEENKCYACGQDFHDDNHESVLQSKKDALVSSLERENQLLLDVDTARTLVVELVAPPVTHYKSESDAIKHSHTVENLRIQIENKRGEEDPFALQIFEISSDEIVCGDQPITHYDTEAQAIKHSSRVASLLDQIANKHGETDPYVEQIAEMEKEAIQTVSFDRINELTKLMQHQEYLLDLLTNKKSFVRKKIIDQNLSYLNSRLTHYLDKMGLPHTVVFQNDLAVEITELGRELDFDNCSRGERTRIILGLSFAFRDVFESLYTPVNILFVDELIDNGLDTIGVENAIALLKDMNRRRNKSVWLVSHRDELTNRVSSVLKVIKQGGYTTYENADELTV